MLLAGSLRARVTSVQQSDDTAFFVIDVMAEFMSPGTSSPVVRTWQVTRRFSAFDNFHATLAAANPRVRLPRLPEKKWKMLMDRECVQEHWAWHECHHSHAPRALRAGWTTRTRTPRFLTSCFAQLH